MVMRPRIMLLRYWFSVSDEEQKSCFQARIDDCNRRWTRSPMDFGTCKTWESVLRAKDVVISPANIPEVP